jgi:hypothetical protein
MSCEENYNDLLKENEKLSNENKRNKRNNRSNHLDKFNSLIDQAAEAITCDANCQKQKTNSVCVGRPYFGRRFITIPRQSFPI